MNDSELEKKLRSVRVPQRAEGYWEDFPSRVRGQLPAPVMERPRKAFVPAWAWAGGFAFACAVFTLVIWPSFQVAVKDEHVIHQELAELPHHLHVLMADEHGMHYLIADQQ
ncbi:MAG TPA: hypothetical protein VGI03_06785 [Verrucomicrobiae bacterium]|jgi:hypothetical protein